MKTINHAWRTIVALALLGAFVGCGGGSDSASSAWQEKTAMPEARAGLRVGVISGALYAFGGQVYDTDTTNYTQVNKLETYDPATNLWTLVTSPTTTPAARSGHAVAVVNGKLYVIGGQVLTTPSGTAITTLGSVEEFDPASNVWAVKTPMPTPRSGLDAGVVNGKIYAIGGHIISGGTVTYYDVVEEYDPLLDAWTPRASMPTARSGLSVNVVNDIIYAVGGRLSSNGYVSTLEAYDPATDAWESRASMYTPRSALSTAVVGTVLYAVGGFQLKDSVLTYLNTAEAYNPATDQWTTISAMLTPRSGFGMGVIDNTIYAVGGYNSTTGDLATVEALTP